MRKRTLECDENAKRQKIVASHINRHELDLIRKDKSVFLGIIPKDIVDIIGTHLFCCVLCNRIDGNDDVIFKLCYNEHSHVDGHLCQAHSQCHACFLILNKETCNTPVYVYKWTWINQFRRHRSTGVTYFVPVCENCHNKSDLPSNYTLTNA